jgi:predicted RNA-binding Zn-ribbon protein involved in translation (DUF1610 family)
VAYVSRDGGGAMRYQLINFVCPECGHESMVAHQEILETVYVDCLYEPGFFGYGEEQDSEVTETFLYTCSRCDFELGRDFEKVVDWLRERGMLGEMMDD